MQVFRKKDRKLLKLKGYLYIFIAAFLWAGIGPVARLAFREGIQPMEVAFWRAVLAWIFFGGHAVATREIHLELRDIPFLLLFAFTGVTLFYGSYQLAVRAGGAALAAVLLYTAPAWVAVMSRLFFREAFTALKLLALLCTMIGVAGVSFGSADGLAKTGLHVTPGAIVFGLLAGFSYSLYYIFGKYFSGRYTSPNLFFYMLPIGAAALIPWVSFSNKSPAAWGCLFFLAFFSTYVAYYCYYIGIQYLEPTRAAMTATLEPFIAAMIAFVWWRETFGLVGYIGSFLIISGVMVMIWDGTRIKRIATETGIEPPI